MLLEWRRMRLLGLGERIRMQDCALKRLVEKSCKMAGWWRGCLDLDGVCGRCVGGVKRLDLEE